MRTVVEKLAGDAVAKMFIHREILIFGVYGGNMSTGLPDETFRLGQHRLADTMATFVGDHGQTTNHPTSGLIGMVEIRVETACRHGAAVSKSQQMRGSARLIPFVEFRTIILLHDEYRRADAARQTHVGGCMTAIARDRVHP